MHPEPTLLKTVESMPAVGLRDSPHSLFATGQTLVIDAREWALSPLRRWYLATTSCHDRQRESQHMCWTARSGLSCRRLRHVGRPGRASHSCLCVGKRRTKICALQAPP